MYSRDQTEVWKKNISKSAICISTYSMPAKSFSVSDMLVHKYLKTTR